MPNATTSHRAPRADAEPAIVFDVPQNLRAQPANISGNQPKLKVAVLVDLMRHQDAGGHVKAWERFAEAAKQFPDDLDLTVYYLGDGETEDALADNVRNRTVPPAFGTARLPWLKNGGGDTDLASYNPHLARRLLEHNVFHATSSFAFAKTAQHVASRHGRPLISSIHTDAAKFAEVYTGEIIEKLVGPGVLGRWLIDSIGISDISARSLNRARDRILKASDHILVSNRQDEHHVLSSVSPNVSFLRRGIDKALFSPTKRDRSWLQRAFAVPIDIPVALFAGRVDESKRVLTVANAARRLIDEGQPLHVIIAGEGSEQAQIEAILGPHVTLAGGVTQEDLARLMASSDMFVFPSESETVGNVVIEARASGLPVVVTADATTGQLVSSPGVDGLATPNGSTEAYAEAMKSLLIDPERRRRMGQNARRSIEISWPDWPDVLAEDLLPVWRAAFEQAAHRNAQTERAA